MQFVIRLVIIIVGGLDAMERCHWTISGPPLGESRWVNGILNTIRKTY